RCRPPRASPPARAARGSSRALRRHSESAVASRLLVLCLKGCRRPLPGRSAMAQPANSPLFRPQLLAGAVLAGLVLLPVAAWLDLRNLSDQTLSTQASSLSSMITDIRGYYTRNVVGRVLEAPGQT